MKLLNLLFAAAFGRDRREIVDCPARCWETDVEGDCVPSAGMIALDCSVVGQVSLIAHSCLFTPENADYNQLYQVFFNSTATPDDPNCIRNITSHQDTVSWTLKYSEAEQCGWDWSTVGDQLIFHGFIRPSENINKLDYQGHTITVSQFPDDIDLTCNFDNHVTIAASFDGYESNLTQSASSAQNVSLFDGFSVTLETHLGIIGTEFTVGENVTAEFSYDFVTAGYDLFTMPYGFFARRCYIENQLDTNQAISLIGGGTTPDQCKMDNTFLDLHLSRSFTATLPSRMWTPSQYTLTFDAFKFQTSSAMTLVCDIEICLTADCDDLTTGFVCPYIY